MSAYDFDPKKAREELAAFVAECWLDKNGGDERVLRMLLFMSGKLAESAQETETLKQMVAKHSNDSDTFAKALGKLLRKEPGYKAEITEVDLMTGHPQDAVAWNEGENGSFSVRLLPGGQRNRTPIARA